MARGINASRQTEGVLRALLAEPEAWRHGYELAAETRLKSGTLYPMLIRLEGHGWLEARWEDETPPGRPRRHLYRLSAIGAEAARRTVGEGTSIAAARMAPAPEGAGP